MKTRQILLTESDESRALIGGLPELVRRVGATLEQYDRDLDLRTPGASN
jgi:hypothetical protein